MKILKKRQIREAQLRQMLIEIHNEVVEVSDRFHTLDLIDVLFLSVAENVTTTQLNQINTSLRNRLKGEDNV